MNLKDKERISAYRRQGYGYKKIAKLLDFPESTVKTFCRRNGLTGIPEQYEHICDYCGAKLVMTPGKKQKRFCSDRCRSRWWAEHHELLKGKANRQFICKSCGKPFTVYGNPHRVYCSHACYIKDRFGDKRYEKE